MARPSSSSEIQRPHHVGRTTARSRDPTTSRSRNATTLNAASPLPPRLLDAHHHLWDGTSRDKTLPDHRIFSTPYGPSQLQANLKAAGVRSTILVQSRNALEENDALTTYVREADFVGGVVYYAPLQRRTAALSVIDALTSHPKPCAVRCLVARDPLSWAKAPEHDVVWRELAARDLCWEVAPITCEQLEAVAEVAARAPDLRIVVDHLARPPAPEGGFEPWATLVAKLALRPNVAMKLSVGLDLLQSCQCFQPEALKRYIAHALDHFSEHRLFLASNWPVIMMRASYATVWGGLSDVLKDLLGDKATASPVFGAAAIAWFRLCEQH